MSTAIAVDQTRDAFMTQIVAVAAVLAAFPAVTLSGTTPLRFKTALQAKITTPANANIVDEEGDLLAVTFLTASPFSIVFTQKGLKRRELETVVSGNF